VVELIQRLPGGGKKEEGPKGCGFIPFGSLSMSGREIWPRNLVFTVFFKRINDIADSLENQPAFAVRFPPRVVVVLGGRQSAIVLRLAGEKICSILLTTFL